MSLSPNPTLLVKRGKPQTQILYPSFTRRRIFYLRYSDSKGVISVAKNVVEVPAPQIIDLFERTLEGQGDMAHDCVHLLGMFVPLPGFFVCVRLDTLLGQIDTHFSFVDAQNFHHFLTTNFEEILDGFNAL